MPIHLIWGDDVAAIDHFISTLSNEIIDCNWSSINLTRLDGSNNEHANQALAEARTPPFGNGGRVVVLRKSPFCNSCPTELVKKFETTIELIPKNSYLILINTNKPDSRLRTTKYIKELIKSKKAKENSFILPAIWDLKGQTELAIKTAERLELKLNSETALKLVNAIGCDSTKIYSELQKLALFTSKNSKINDSNITPNLITSESIHALIGEVTTNSLQVGESLLANDIGDALSKLDTLLDTGEPALKIIATLTGQIRGWLWVTLLEQNGIKDVATIAKTAGINNPKRIYVMRKQLRGQSSTHFLNLLKALLEIEANLKRGAAPKNSFRDGLLNNRSRNLPHTEIINY